MTASTLVILMMTLAPQAPVQAPAVDPAKALTLTGCVVPAVDREDTLQLVAAEPDPARPVGTSGVSPAWTVPAYLLLGGIVSFAEHANKTVEVTGTIELPDPSEPRPPVPATTTAIVAPARLRVQSAKVIASACTPRAIKK